MESATENLLRSIVVARLRVSESVTLLVFGRELVLPAGANFCLPAEYCEGVVSTSGLPFDGWLNEQVSFLDADGKLVLNASLRWGWLNRSQRILVRVGG